MANPTTDYQLPQNQAHVERVARYIFRLNPGISYTAAYTKAVRAIGRASGQERKRLR